MHTYSDTYKHKGLRNQLLAVLKAKGIKNEKVLEAIACLPRHFFLPPEFETHAYEDKAFPIGENQTISQPYTVAYQTELLNIQPGDRILEIGTGSGYQAAVLYLCGADVHSIERHALLSETAALTFKNLKQHQKIHINPTLYIGDGSKGCIESAPYDKILVTAAAPSIPKALVNQLKIGGQLVIPVGKNSTIQKMVRLTKQEAGNNLTEIFAEFSFVPLVGENAWKF